MADTLDSGSSAARRKGSSPFLSTNLLTPVRSESCGSFFVPHADSSLPASPESPFSRDRLVAEGSVENLSRAAAVSFGAFSARHVCRSGVGGVFVQEPMARLFRFRLWD